MDFGIPESIRNFLQGGEEDLLTGSVYSLRWAWIYFVLFFLLSNAAYPLLFSKKRLFYNNKQYQWVKISLILWLSTAWLIRIPSVASSFDDTPLILAATFASFFVSTLGIMLFIAFLHQFLSEFLSRISFLPDTWTTAAASLLGSPLLLRKANTFGTIIGSAAAISLLVSFMSLYCATYKGVFCDFISYNRTSRAQCGATLATSDKSDNYSRLKQYFDCASPISQLWGALVIILMTRVRVKMYEVEAIEDGKEEKNKESGKNGPDDFLPMAEWYSVMILNTAFDFLVSLKLFLGRFDMRTMQACFPVNHEIDFHDFSSSSFEDKDGSFYFDFTADTGDGGHSTYTVARNLAQPKLSVARDLKPKNSKNNNKPGNIVLPRGKIMILGGDLCYPLPTVDQYNKRLFKPFEYALHPPDSYNPNEIISNKDELIDKNDDAPKAFIIPGNHDWYDGLQTFIRCILFRNFIGGWEMPQKRSYWALKLPKGWWVLGVDLALNDDIDMHQYKYFAKINTDFMKDGDRAVVCTHEPCWLLDAYSLEDDTSSPNLKALFQTYFSKNRRVAVRIAGDVHSYLRHTVTEDETSRKNGAPNTLIVEGGGGAFMHPTHNFPKTFSDCKATYTREACYPSDFISRLISIKNVFGFRMLNWRFDSIAVLQYYLILYSFFPRCDLEHITHSPLFWDGINAFFKEVLNMMFELFDSTWVSLISVLVLWYFMVNLIDTHIGIVRRLLLGTVHTGVHIFCAFILFLFLQILISFAIEDKVVSPENPDDLFENYLKAETSRLNENWQTSSVFTPFLRILLRQFDTLGAVSRGHYLLCGDNDVDISRYDMLLYYAGNGLALFLISADVFSFIFGVYLWLTCSLFDLQWNEGYSSIRYPHYKGFLRFKIDKNGDLHGYKIGIDRVPHEWALDPKYSSKNKPSYRAKHPSKWVRKPERFTRYKTPKDSFPKLKDFFTIKKS